MGGGDDRKGGSRMTCDRPMVLWVTQSFVNTFPFVHKHVKMNVGKWIWKTLVHTNMSKFLRTTFSLTLLGMIVSQ